MPYNPGHCHLIYTSGWQKPQGCEMTHANLHSRYAIDEVLGIHFGDRVTRPSCHRRIADQLTRLYLQEMFGAGHRGGRLARTIISHAPRRAASRVGAVHRFRKSKAEIEFTVARETDEMKRRRWRGRVGGTADAPTPLL